MPVEEFEEKPRDWCGTKPSKIVNEANQTPFPDPKNMLFPEGKDFYPCRTQDGILATFGFPPGAGGVGNDNGQDSLVVGLGPLIPRWNASVSNPTKLLYFVIRDGFASDDDFEYTAMSFQQAADEWNAIGFGLNISRTFDRALANFAVKYYKPVNDRGVLASAFFPNVVEDVLVYDKTLVSPKWRKVLKNTFLHEIGHILGLRHEFAISGDDMGNKPELDDPARQFGSKNPISVMSYEDVNYIQDTDRHDVKEFYRLPNRAEIDGVPITDYTPTPYLK